MFEAFTEKSMAVIMLAQDEARRLGHNFLGTEELLLGLMSEPSGGAAKALTQLGIDLRQARREVEALVSRGPGYQAIALPLTERVQESFEMALDISRQLNAPKIDTKHLLLGLLEIEDALANVVLQNLGVEFSELRRQLLDPMEGDNGSLNHDSVAIAQLVAESTADMLPHNLSHKLDAIIDRLSRTLAETEAINQRVKTSLNTSPSLNPSHADPLEFNRNIIDRLARLEDSLNPEQPGLKACLIELRAALMNSHGLSTLDKVEGLEQIRVLAESGRDPADFTFQRMASLAIKILRGTLATLPLEDPLVEVGSRCLAAIAQQFNLG